MILTVPELAAFPRYSVCGQRSLARWSLSVLALLDEFRWCLGLGAWVEQTAPALGVYDSDSDLWKMRLDVDGHYCNH